MNTRKIVVWTRADMSAHAAEETPPQHSFKMVDACGRRVSESPVRWAFALR